MKKKEIRREALITEIGIIFDAYSKCTESSLEAMYRNDVILTYDILTNTERSNLALYISRIGNILEELYDGKIDDVEQKTVEFIIDNFSTESVFWEALHSNKLEFIIPPMELGFIHDIMMQLYDDFYHHRLIRDDYQPQKELNKLLANRYKPNNVVKEKDTVINGTRIV